MIELNNRQVFGPIWELKLNLPKKPLTFFSLIIPVASATRNNNHRFLILTPSNQRQARGKRLRSERRSEVCEVSGGVERFGGVLGTLLCGSLGRTSAPRDALWCGASGKVVWTGGAAWLRGDVSRTWRYAHCKEWEEEEEEEEEEEWPRGGG